jgi:hypothetical protein
VNGKIFLLHIVSEDATLLGLVKAIKNYAGLE